MNLNVLIIQDDDIVALQIKKIVSFLGHKTLKIVKNATDVIEISKKNKIDLVISETNIQGNRDGIECCSFLQETYNTSVIFVTTHSDIGTLHKASKVNFIAYLLRPFRENELKAMITLVILKNNVFKIQKRDQISKDYSYNTQTGELFFQNNYILLTKKETKFLSCLIKANGTIVTYDTLDELIWGREFVSEGTRRQLIYRFKQKVLNFPFSLIKGVGYKLDL